MISILYIVISFSLFISSISFSIFLFKMIDHKRELANVSRFKSYLSLFNYFLEKSYDIVYKDSILIYSLEATKMNDIEFEKTTKKFGLLFLKMVGPSLKERLIDFFGNEETLMFNIIEYFNSKFEADEIRKTAVDNLTENNG